MHQVHHHYRRRPMTVWQFFVVTPFVAWLTIEFFGWPAIILWSAVGIYVVVTIVPAVAHAIRSVGRTEAEDDTGETYGRHARRG